MKEIKSHVYRKRLNVNLCHKTKFFHYLSLTVLYLLLKKISSVTLFLSTRIVLDCSYLLISYSEKFPT